MNKLLIGIIEKKKKDKKIKGGIYKGMSRSCRTIRIVVDSLESTGDLGGG